MSHRQGHFMPTALLDSQFATLQPLEAGRGGCLRGRLLVILGKIHRRVAAGYSRGLPSPSLEHLPLGTFLKQGTTVTS